MVKFSGLGQVKSFLLEEARELIGFGREDGSSRVKIPGIDVVIRATPIPAIPIQSIMPLPQDELAHIPLPSRSQCFLSIGRIPSFGEDLFDSRSRLDGSKGVCPQNDDGVKSIHRVNTPTLVPCPQRPLRAPQGGVSTFNADVIIKEVDKNVAHVFGKAILNKVSCTPFDGLPSLKGDSDSLYATILQTGKLDKAFRQLNTEGAHFEATALS
ncbi:hypothetical protein Cgig2_006880 [Carnegiea gigantea]|uniref:Uncharacterized protein n=1 Tax=Carnegiea gigantea TaxID=171969 RepID=A0A9Q1K3Q1_9CARY|nr:hypothetical protein Cgig2_006880 [Carnegiea gigantea]